MADSKPRTYLIHPAHGELPARRVLDCVFALSPNGTILHHHIEELRSEDAPAGLRYHLLQIPPAAGRERCRIIPPRTREF